MNGIIDKSSKLHLKIFLWAISISFFLGAVLAVPTHTPWKGWLFVLAGLFFNLDYRWGLRADLQHMFIESPALKAISWSISFAILMLGVVQVFQGAIELGAICVIAGLGINPELRQRMKLKLWPVKAVKPKV